MVYERDFNTKQGDIVCFGFYASFTMLCVGVDLFPEKHSFGVALRLPFISVSLHIYPVIRG